MSFQPSLRRRRMSLQSARLSQPQAWHSSAGLTSLLLNNNGFSMTASSTANTPGAWVQYITKNQIAASDTITAIHIQAVGNNQAVGSDNSMLLDIGKGAAGSEVIVAQNISVGGAQNSGGYGSLCTLPVRIDGATRVACRVRAATGSRVLTMTNIWASGMPTLSPFADRLPTAVDTLGTSTATSAGTAMSGASGTWTEITSATTKDYQSLVLLPSGPSSASTTGGTFRLDLGIGSAGAEIQVAYFGGVISSAGGIGVSFQSVQTAIYGGFVPAGTRIAVRHNLASGPERVCACVIGVPYV